MRKTLAVGALLVFVVSLFSTAVQAQSYTYIRIGEKSDAKTIPSFGIAMMGGGSDLDEAFRCLCQKVIPVIPFSWSIEVVGSRRGNRPEVENVLEASINTRYYRYV